MSTQTYASVRLTLFKHSSESFLAALDEAKIPHEPIRTFSSNPQGSGLIELIIALSKAMPWNAIAKVAVAWIDARKSREIIIHTVTGDSINAKGYSASEIQKILQKSTSVLVIDTKPIDES